MAEITKQALKVDNNQSFPNNNNGAITPSILRAFNVNMIDSMVDEIGYNVDSGSWNQQIDALEQFTASASGLTTGSLLITASAVSNVITFTKGNGSTFNVTVATGSIPDISNLNQATASLQAFTQSAQVSINNLNTTTASLNSSVSQLNASSASQQISINALNVSSASQQVSIDNLNSKTGSYATTGSNTFVGANTFTSISASSFVSASEFIGNGSKITGITASISMPILDEGIPQGNAVSLNFTGSGISAFIAGGTAIISVNTPDSGTVNNLTASFNAYTASTNLDLAAIHQATASLQLFTASFSTSSLVSTASFNQYTQSNDQRVTSLESATASLFTSASLALVTASFDNGTRNLTFTKGDNTTFNVNIPDVSGSTLPTGVISGSAQITALGFVSSSITASSIITASVNNDDITFTKGDGSQFTIQVATGSFAISASFAETASFALNGGVTQILAGPNITVSPLSGKGQVTISSTGTGSGGFNTATGSYGSFYDTTTQINPVANTARSMSFNETAITNGVSISGSTNPFNTYIKTENAGVYNLQFSAQLDKTDSGTDSIDIWIRKNGIDLLDTGTTVTLTGNNDKSVAAWNWFVQSAANDYYQIIWSSADTDMRLLAEASSSIHPGIPSVIATVNRVDQFLSNTGSFSGSFTGTFNGYNLTEFTTTSSFNSYTSSNDQKVNSLIAATGSYATTGSNSFNGNQTITGSVTISGSATTDLTVVGQIYVSSSATGGTTQPRIIVSGSQGTSTITRNFISTRNLTYSAQLNPYAIFAGVVSTSDEIGLSVDAFTGGISGWPTGSAIYINDPGGTFPAIFGFQNKASYTDGRVTVLTPLSASAGFTASLQNGYTWVGNSLGQNTQVATSSFATTGSNSFNGNQTITGSLILSSSAAIELQVIGDTQFTGSLIMSSSNAVELTVIGNMVVTGSAFGNVVSMSITANTASMDLSRGNYFTLTLADTATTHISASNVQPGVSATLVITTGTNSSASLAPTMLQPSGSAYSATNGSSKKDVLSIVAVASGVPFVVSTKNMI